MTEQTDVMLLPCPFCGGEASDAGHVRYSRPLADTEWDDGSPITEAFRVNCIQCGVANGSVIGGYRTKAEAVAKWNQRHRLTHPPADQRLREAAQTLLDLYVELANSGDCGNWNPETEAEVIAVRTALAAPLDDGWLPIGDAPKDGSYVLGFGPHATRTAYMDVIHYFRDRWTITWMDGYGEPTHYRPLPSAPTSPILSIGEGM